MCNSIEKLKYLQQFITETRMQKIDRVLDNRTKHITVVLEDIYHPHNASAVIRTCDCFGIQDLHIIENLKSYRPNKCITQGSAKWINLNKYNTYKNNTEDCFVKLKGQGYKIVATSLCSENVTTLEELPLNNKLALCFGTEEFGLSEKAHKLADYTVKIPMFGFTQSFNISVCAALCLHSLVNRLHNSDIFWKLPDIEKQKLRFEWVVKSIKNVDSILKRFD